MITIVVDGQNLQVTQPVYDHEWQVEIRTGELVHIDHPTGRLARRLPQLRPRDPDPIGDAYRRLARTQLEASAEPM